MFALQWEMTDTEAWRDEALCRDGSAALTELFFSEQLDDIARAKQFCRACPVLSDSCFSQWWPCRFSVAGQEYPSAEHFMMAGKARVFGDSATLQRILVADDARRAKALGRRVQGFNEESWAAVRFDLVTLGSFAKFSQDAGLHDYLLGTGEDVLVEASPVDAIWGIGLAQTDALAQTAPRLEGTEPPRLRAHACPSHSPPRVAGAGLDAASPSDGRPCRPRPGHPVRSGLSRDGQQRSLSREHPLERSTEPAKGSLLEPKREVEPRDALQVSELPGQVDAQGVTLEHALGDAAVSAVGLVVVLKVDLLEVIAAAVALVVGDADLEEKLVFGPIADWACAPGRRWRTHPSSHSPPSRRTRFACASGGASLVRSGRLRRCTPISPRGDVHLRQLRRAVHHPLEGGTANEALAPAFRHPRPHVVTNADSLCLAGDDDFLRWAADGPRWSSA